MNKLKIACIGAGSSGTGHMILLEKYAPGSVVAFCDLDRKIFDTIVEGYMSAKMCLAVQKSIEERKVVNLSLDIDW